MTVGSMVDWWRSEVAVYAMRLVGQGLAQVVASDTHSLRRVCGFPGATSALTKANGRVRTERLVSRVLAAILTD